MNNFPCMRHGMQQWLQRVGCNVSPVKVFRHVSHCCIQAARWPRRTILESTPWILFVVCWAWGKMSSWLCVSTAHRSSGNQGCWRRGGGWSKARPIAIDRAVAQTGRCRFMSSICHPSIQYGLWSVLRARSKTAPGWEMFRLNSAPLRCGRDQRATKRNSRRAKRWDVVRGEMANCPG